MILTDKQIRDLVAEAQEDEVGLWLILSTVRRTCGIHDSQELRLATLDCVRRLLESGQVVAGMYAATGGGIDIWNIPVLTILERISIEWDMLGREPSIGDIVVLVGASEKVSGE